MVKLHEQLTAIAERIREIVGASGSDNAMLTEIERDLLALIAQPAPTGEVAIVAYRLHTGSPRSKWQWMDGPPSAGAIREAELHGWEIEYAYADARVAAERLRAESAERLAQTRLDF